MLHHGHEVTEVDREHFAELGQCREGRAFHSFLQLTDVRALCPHLNAGGVPVETIEGSEALVGYRVHIMRRPAFTVRGYTLIVPPRSPGAPKQFWGEVSADGRLAQLIGGSSVRPWVLGLGSWDPECAKKGFRYTICIEETEHTDFGALAAQHDLFTKQIGASDWMCFEMTEAKYDARFWKDNPYKMMGELGYEFHEGGEADVPYSLGLHFDAYPPDQEGQSDPCMEFWITVRKSGD